jgi:predicted dehydrogenase
MKALVLGCGSIGLRHIGHLRQVGLSNVAASDPEPEACRRAQERFGIPVSQDPDEALRHKPDIVLVCTPAALHIPVALKALEAGAHVFVEKPLSTSLQGVDLLVQEARASRKVVQVGYNLRFHPAFKAMRRLVQSHRLGKILAAHAEFGLYLPLWWPGRDYTQSYMTRREKGGGLLLDASHEIDLLHWFLGEVKEVTAFGGKLSSLHLDGIDIAKVVVKMRCGAIASLHLDCLQPTYTRVYSLVGERTCLRWDCPEGRVDSSLGRLVWFDSKSNRFQRIALRGRPEDTYLKELEDFLRCVKTGKLPLVGLEHGIAALRVALAIQEAMETGQVTGVDGCLRQ